MNPTFTSLLALPLVAGCSALFGPPAQAADTFRNSYEQVVSGDAHPANLEQLRVALENAKTCYGGGGNEVDSLRVHYPDSSVTTSKGSRTIGAMALECSQVHDRLRQQNVAGCGARVLTMSSDIMGSGAWTPETIENALVDKEGLVAVDCDKVKAVAAAPNPGMDRLKRHINSSCGEGLVGIALSDWQFEKNKQGVAVHREALAYCLHVGTFDKWQFADARTKRWLERVGL